MRWQLRSSWNGRTRVSEFLLTVLTTMQFDYGTEEKKEGK